jgi:hypothetical protein
MDRTTPIGDVLSLLKREIAERQAIVAKLESLLTPMPRTRTGVGEAAAEILRAVGRPMHGLREILPALEERGFIFKTRQGFGTMLIRTGRIRRVAPGTFAPAERGGEPKST